MIVSRILHAGYIFEYDQIKIAFDPIFENPFSRNCYAFPNVRFDYEKIKDLRFNAIFISHHHDDHCSLESLNLLDRQTPIYIYCLHEDLLSMIRELGFSKVYSIEIDKAIHIGPFEITPRRALDSDVDSIFHIKASGLNVLNVVDSWIDGETIELLAKTAPWDLVLWPFQTMRELEVISPSRVPKCAPEIPIEWKEQLKILNPRYIVPSSCQFVQESWSWYNHAFFPITYRQFSQEISAQLPGSKIIRMNPSTSFVLDSEAMTPATSLTWMIPVGNQDVDYEYDQNIKPPSSAQIAKHFEALDGDQTYKVYEYCRVGIVERFNSLEPSDEPFFKKPRIWSLSVFDHAGGETSFHYLIRGTTIEILKENSEPLSWLTEVPISKLYAALELGESLTSMYIRINDIVFDSATEKEIQSVDITEDPLIRCLFTGVFGAYQAEQLKRIKIEKRNLEARKLGN